MKSRVQALSISGAIIAFFCAAISCSIAFQWAKFGEFSFPPGSSAYAEAMARPLSSYDIQFFVPAALCVLGAALGILAAVFVERKARASGVLLIIASIISIFTIFGIIATILFIIAAVSSLSIKTDSPVPPKPKQNGLQNAALTLCIIGAVIAVSISLIVVIFSANDVIPNDHVIKSLSSEINDMYMIQFIRSIIALAGGVLGIFSALSIRKKMRRAGVMMIIAAVFCVCTCWYIPTVLFTISAVFVFVYAKKQQTQQAEDIKQPEDELIP